MISQFMGSSSESGSVPTALSLLQILSASLFAPPLLMRTHPSKKKGGGMQGLTFEIVVGVLFVSDMVRLLHSLVETVSFCTLFYSFL